MPRPAPLFERLKACLEKHPEWDDARIAAAIVGSGIENVRSVRAGGPLVTPVEEEKPVETGTISLSQVRARYDVAAAIRRELGKLKPGALILESEMRVRAAGKDANRFRRAVENTEEFKAHRVKLQLDPEGGEAAWYWGDSATIVAAIKVRDSI